MTGATGSDKSKISRISPLTLCFKTRITEYQVIASLDDDDDCRFVKRITQDASTALVALYTAHQILSELTADVRNLASAGALCELTSDQQFLL